MIFCPLIRYGAKNNATEENIPSLHAHPQNAAVSSQFGASRRASELDFGRLNGWSDAYALSRRPRSPARFDSERPLQQSLQHADNASHAFGFCDAYSLSPAAMIGNLYSRPAAMLSYRCPGQSLEAS
jgi:hypothetical protein